MLFPWRKQPEEESKDQKWQDEPDGSHEVAFGTDQANFKAGKTVKAF